jgi:glycosyltransferase involved in cell wall biosynthesis
MIRLFVNGVAASAGGGLTYLRNVVPQLAHRPDCHTTVLVGPQLRREFAVLPNIAALEMPDGRSTFRRFASEQMQLPKLIRQNKAQVLVSTGNFAVWNSPVPQILLSRNSLYISVDFRRDLRERGKYAMLADTLLKGWVARTSVRRSEITVAPSQAFAAELQEWSGKKIVAVQHGFDRQAFTADPTPLSPHTTQLLESAADSVRLLFVSHYNYYRNFETLFRAMPILSKRLNGKLKLFLTCQLKSGKNPGTYRTETAAEVAGDLNARENIIELGTIPYGSLHHLYRACHIYVTPAYAESFAHPLVEAMSSGLPVVASDLPVHREICGDAALHFSRFSAEELAERILQVKTTPGLAERLSRNGLQRANAFSWSTHVDLLLIMARQLVKSRNESR